MQAVRIGKIEYQCNMTHTISLESPLRDWRTRTDAPRLLGGAAAARSCCASSLRTGPCAHVQRTC